MTMLRFLVFLLVALVTVPSLGRAASFDCAKAGTAVEKAICGDGDLSNLDDRLAQIYKIAIGRLDARQRDRLRAKQLRWLDSLKDCTNPGVQDTANCLIEDYRDRLEFLKVITQKAMLGEERIVTSATTPFTIGPYQFQTILASAPVCAGQTMDVEYPQIIAPQNARTRTWNQMMVPKANDGGDRRRINEKPSCTPDYDNDFGRDDNQSSKITIANSRLISVTRKGGYASRLAAHPYNYTQIINVLMGEKVRPLEGEDIFRSDSDWAGRLAELCIAQLKADKGLYDGADMVSIARQVASPTNWAITEDKLTIVNVLSYTANNWASVTIPWSKLRAYLVADLAFRTKH